MSEAFSDDLSDPTPSPPPVAVRSSASNKSSAVPGNNNTNNNTRRGSNATSKATTHQRTTSAASVSATTRVPGPHGHKGVAASLASASHSRNTSLANSLVVSQSAASGKGSMVNGHPRSDDDEDDDGGEDEEEEEDNGSQSGSDLSSPPSEGVDQPKRVITEEPLGANDEANEEENEEGDEDDNEDDEKANDDEDDDGDEEENPFAVRPQPRHGRTSSGGTGAGILPPRATRQSSLRSGSAAGRTGRGVIPAGMWEWAKKKNYKKPKADKSDDGDDDGSDGEEGEEEEDEEDGAGVEGRPGDSRGESLVQQGRNVADEDEPMLNGMTDLHSPNGTFNSDDDIATQHLPIPTVKIEPPPSATMSSFRAQDLAHPSPSVSPAPTPAPTGASERRTNGRPKASGRTNSKRSHRAPPAHKRSTAAQQQQQLQLQLQQQQLQDAEDDAEAEEVERANREMEVAEDAEDGEDEEGELEGEAEYGNRQDALDALSLLELKFALLRQRIYQDKMDELGREESLVRDGSHPELLHTYIELDKRKERRATLAEHKRKHEVDLAAVTRINDEDAIWSWWMIQKDVVQSTLITEASRKRRRVERERRALLDPLRRTLGRVTPPVEPPLPRDRDGDEDMLPSRPSTKAILAVALRHPYARLRTYDSAHLAKNKHGESVVGLAGASGGGKSQESMPTLSQLDPTLIREDLDVLQGYRRGSGALGAVINAGAGLAMPEAGIPGGIGGPSGMYGPPGMDTGISGTVTVNNAVVAPAPEAFNPGIGVIGVDPAQTGGVLPYPRSMYELEQRERGRHRDGPAFNDHLAAHQYMSTGMPPNGGGKGPSNGRDRERDRDRPGSKKHPTSNAPSMGHANYVSGQAPAPQQQQQQQQRERDMHSHGGYPPHSHRQAVDPYASPGLGLQNMQRLPDSGNPRDRDRDNGMGGIQHMPLPPAPSTIPAGSSSGASKHHHHHHPAPPAPGHPQASQHPSLMWDGSRRERDRDRESDLARERSHSSANRNPGMSGSGYATNPGLPSGNGGVSSSSGRPHSHSVSHPHQHAHYHPTHTHSRSSAQGNAAHTHSHGVLHTHPHSHSHAAGSTSHLHVIHNHGPGPTGNGGSAGGNGTGTSSSSRRNNAYDEGASGPSGSGHRSRTSYPSGPTVDREKELRERERLAGAAPSMNVMHPSLSHGGGQERDRHTGYSIPHSSRDSWADREREKVRPKERDDRRDPERERTSHSHSGMSGLSGFSGHQVPQQQQQQGGGSSNRGGRSGSLSMHPSQGNSYSQGQAPLPGSRYPYANPSAYSPPATQASQSRRNSPPPVLPPVPNTSRYGTGSSTHRRASPSPTDPLSYSSSSQAQAEIASIHSPTSSLNPLSFNPWSATPKSSGRAYRPPSPPQKITPPTGTPFNSSAGGGPLNPLPGPTLSPILPSAVSPAPRPPISPAPRPPSSSSLHAILQPSPRESALSPRPVKRNGSGSGEGGSGVGPMELDSLVQQQQTGVRHPSLALLNQDAK